MAHMFITTLATSAYFNTSGVGPSSWLGSDPNPVRFPTSSPTSIGRPRSTRRIPAGVVLRLRHRRPEAASIRPFLCMPGLFKRAMLARQRFRVPRRRLVVLVSGLLGLNRYERQAPTLMLRCFGRFGAFERVQGRLPPAAFAQKISPEISSLALTRMSQSGRTLPVGDTSGA